MRCDLFGRNSQRSFEDCTVGQYAAELSAMCLKQTESIDDLDDDRNGVLLLLLLTITARRILMMHNYRCIKEYNVAGNIGEIFPRYYTARRVWYINVLFTILIL